MHLANVTRMESSLGFNVGSVSGDRAMPQTREAKATVFEEHRSDIVTLPEHRRQEIRKVILASYFGTTIEYYDFLLYTSAASLVFAKVFFSSVDPATGTILSFVTLLAGYLGRPIGGIVFGHYGDRLGRKRMLVITMALIGSASTLIGLLPTYAQWGALAPILLVGLRIVQGIAVGGDWGGSATICVESAESGKRGLTAAFVNMGAPSGAVLASLVLALFSAMDDADFLAWGWRIPFLLSAVLVVLGIKVRLGMSESPLFMELQQKDTEQQKRQVPIVAVFKHQSRAVLLAGFGTMSCFALQGILASYGLTLATTVGGHSRTSVLVAYAVAAILSVLAVAFYGHLSDRFGRRRVLMIGSLLGILLAYPVFWMIANGSAVLLFLGFIIGLPLVQSAIYGPSAAFISEMFSTQYRYTGASIGYQIAATLGGGVSPLIAVSLAAAGNFAAVTVYIMATFVLGLLIVRLAQEGTRINLQNVALEVLKAPGRFT
jgi:MFS transporter, MHS family, shikimate and dehydroshikimate transport protein